MRGVRKMRKLTVRDVMTGELFPVGTDARREEAVDEVMSGPPLAVAAEASALEAAHLLVRHGVDRLAVIDDDGRPIGTVTAIDVLRAFLRPDAEVCEEVEHDVFGHALGIRLDGENVRVGVLDGVVTLRGRVERGSVAQDAVRLTGEVDGVARVIDQLTFAFDDMTGALGEFEPATGEAATAGR